MQVGEHSQSTNDKGLRRGPDSRVLPLELSDLVEETQRLEGVASDTAGAFVAEVDAGESEAVDGGVDLSNEQVQQFAQRKEKIMVAQQKLMAELNEAKRALAAAREERAKYTTLSNFFGKGRDKRQAAQDALDLAEDRLSQVQGALDSEVGQQVQSVDSHRDQLATTEREHKKATSGFRGLFSKKWEQLSSEWNVEDARESYEKERAELVGDSILAMLEEQSALADARAAETKGAESHLYRLHKQLGDINLANVTGWEPESKIGKVVSKAVSVRTAINLSLVGTGMGLAAAGLGEMALTSYIARRVVSFGASGAGSYDMLRMRDAKKIEKQLAEDRTEGLPDDELFSFKAHMEAMASVNGVRISDNPVYQKLKQEVGTRLEAKRSAAEQGDAEQAVELSVEQMLRDSDKELDTWLTQEGKEDMKRRAIAAGISAGLGAFVASGLAGKVVKEGIKGVGWGLGHIGDALIGSAEAAEPVAEPVTSFVEAPVEAVPLSEMTLAQIQETIFDETVLPATRYEAIVEYGKQIHMATFPIEQDGHVYNMSVDPHEEYVRVLLTGKAPVTLDAVAGIDEWQWAKSVDVDVDSVEAPVDIPHAEIEEASAIEPLEEAESVDEGSLPPPPDEVEVPPDGAIESGSVQPDRDALYMLEERKVVMVEDGPIVRFDKLGDQYEVRIVNFSPDMHERTTELLGAKWQEVIAEHEGRAVRDVAAEIDYVVQHASKLSEMMRVRDYMIEKGLDKTPQFEALVGSIEYEQDQVSVFGHVMRDDPDYVGGKSADDTRTRREHTEREPREDTRTRRPKN